MENYRISKTIINDPKNGINETSNWIYDNSGFLERIATNENKYEFFIYENNLLVSVEDYENGKRIAFSKYEYDKNNKIKDILTKITTFRENGIIKSFKVFVFEEDLMLKTLNYNSENILRFEYIYEYDKNGKKIFTYRQNAIEYAGQEMYYLYSKRKYNEIGLLEEIIFSDESNVKYIWEEGITTYNYNKYFVN